ncbi:uncharacterized protein CLAFUR5_09222 [Fulvia fulva]|uniref:Uncharacterized protein n=1 Tax=Passalora fulva TaxID=5499 RepID=A0A9Q8UTR8_PASFU|nr:uncharacterized protein CLAFUR5_09222 [Fulvia fulva]UJO22105.1 hypothetical protein CLAFUR5_09222 [Fulvia fulva]
MATRVCKTWQSNIQASHKLQRALYFESAPGDPLKFSHKRQHIDPSTYFTPQHLLLQHFRGEVYHLPPADPKAAEDWEYMWTISSPAPRQPVPVTIHPLWEIFHELFDTHFQCLPESDSSTPTPAWRRPEASWRRMLLSDRAFKCHLLFRSETSSMMEHNDIMRIRDSRRWPLGRIFDKAVRHVRRAPWIKKVRREDMNIDMFEVEVRAWQLWDEMEGHDGWPDSEEGTIAAILGREENQGDDEEEEAVS